MKTKPSSILNELKHHVPFTVLATFIAIILVFIITEFELFNIPEATFHGFHYLHVLVSATATAAIYHRYKKSFAGAIIIGILGAIIIGSLSDVLFPYLGSLFFEHLHAEFHLPIMESTIFVLSFAFIGGVLGAWKEKSKTPHFIHVLLSVFASFFYLYSFTFNWGLGTLFIVFAIVFISVIIPCCLSDIIFPFLFLGKK